MNLKLIRDTTKVTLNKAVSALLSRPHASEKDEAASLVILVAYEQIVWVSFSKQDRTSTFS